MQKLIKQKKVTEMKVVCVTFFPFFPVMANLAAGSSAGESISLTLD